MSMDPRTRSRIGLRLAPILIMAVMAGIFALQSCQEGPFGRKQVVALAPEQENQLGLEAFQEVLAKEHVLSRGPIPQAVIQISERLARASSSPEFCQAVGIEPRDFDWEFRVVESDQINAFCLPGGKVVVYTGILPVAQTEAGLATVVGHEIGHALARHGAERMAQTQIVQMVQQGVAGSMADMNPAQVQQVMGMLGVGAQVGILLPFGRDHESEADHIGILLMAAAGYDPREASRFWVRMQEATQGQGKPPEFLSTHPSSERRASDLEAWLPEALPLYEHSDQQPSSKPLPLSALGAPEEPSFLPGNREPQRRQPFPFPGN